MIQYNKGAFGLNLLFRLHGSAIYRAFFPGFLGVMIYLFIRFFWRSNGLEVSDDLGHPYAVGVLVGSTSFLIIFRANHGYSRYWEACGAVHQFLSKWMDAVTHTACYHMQCDHYVRIKPPSYFDHPDLNDGHFTRDRERGDHKHSDVHSLKLKNWNRSIAKSINFVEDPKKREQAAITEEEEVADDAPRHLLGQPRLDGGWADLFPKATGQNATYYNPQKEWNHDGKGFASLSGGRTPALFLQELAHLASLLSAVALSTLRNDIEGAESPLGFYEPGSPWPEVDPTKVEGLDYGWSGVFKYMTGADRTPQERTKHNALRPLLVIGGVSDNEIKFLQMARGPYAKTQLAWQWVSEFIIREHLAGSTGAVGAPIISRIIQFLGDGMIFYNHARKIMWIPFPFPHAQMSVFFIITIVFAVPFLMDQYANETWLACVLTFFTITCLAGLHEVARELENPFRNVPNDLPLNRIQAYVNEVLITMYGGYHPDHFFQPDIHYASMKRRNMKSAKIPPQESDCTDSGDVPSASVGEEQRRQDPRHRTLSELEALVEQQSDEIARLKELVETTHFEGTNRGIRSKEQQQ